MLVPVAPSNGSLAPPGDIEPGKKAEISLAPQVLASYLVLGKEESGKAHSHTTLQPEMSSPQLCSVLS